MDRAAMPGTPESTPLLADEPGAGRRNRLSEDRAIAKGGAVSRWGLGDWLGGTHRGQFTCILCVVAVLQVLGAVTWRFLGGNGDYGTSWEASFWFAWGMYFDPGTQMGLAAHERHWIKAVAAYFSVIGFLCNLLTLGFFVDLMRTTLDGLYRDGHRVVDNGHVLLLGWSERTVFLLAELMSASLNRVDRSSRIVILADVDEEYMRQQIDYSSPGKSWRRRITVFRGSPYQVKDLMKVSAPSASQIINLGSTGKSQRSDRDTLQVVVALASLRDEPGGNIINTVRCEDTIPVIDNIFRRAEGILARETVLRIMCLKALQPAIGNCFQTLASYRRGEELYCMSLSALGLSPESHRTFGDVCLALDRGICIGIKRAGKALDMAPLDSYRIDAEEDKFMVIADMETDIARQDTRASSGAAGRAASKAPVWVAEEAPRRVAAAPTIIIVGWAADIVDTIEILDQYLPPRSKLHLLARESEEARKRQLEPMVTRNIAAADVTHHVGSPACVEDLRELPLLAADAIFVLAEGAHHTKPTGSDSRCLASAISIHNLLVEDRAQQIGGRLFCEVLSPRTFRMLEKNAPLGACANFFHSNAVETGLIAMASANRAVYNTIVFLLQPETIGKFVLVPAGEYFSDSQLERQDGGGVLFWDLWRCARRRNEILLGWKTGQELWLNPGSRDRPVRLSGDDSLIAIRCSA